jgi:hypothetical protein
MRNKHKIKTCAALVALATVGTSFGGQASKSVKPIKSVSSVEGSLEANYVSGYVFRGQLLDSNSAFQPVLALSVPFDASKLGLDSAAVEFKTLQSFNQNSPVAGWYRSEVDIGVSLTKGMFTVRPSYQFFNSPTGKFDSSQGFNLLVTAKDPIGLNPFVNGFFGVDGNAGNGSSSGIYYEVGVNPSATFSKVTVGVPVSFGFGSKNYYKNNESYGFSSVGLTASYPIMENLNVHAGIRYLNTSDSLNSGKNDIFTSTVGLGLTF